MLVDTGKLEFFIAGETPAVCHTISELCKLQDFRSRHQKNNIKASNYNFDFDNLHIDIEMKSLEKPTQQISNSTLNKSSGQSQQSKSSGLPEVSRTRQRSRSLSRQRVVEISSEHASDSDMSRRELSPIVTKNESNCSEKTQGVLIEDEPSVDCTKPTEQSVILIKKISLRTTDPSGTTSEKKKKKQAKDSDQ